MLIQLDESQYSLIAGLYENLRYNLVVDSIIDGNTPAWVFTDRAPAPRTALLWNMQDALLLAGEAENSGLNADLAEIIAERIIPHATGRGIPELSLHYTPEDWEQHIHTVLPGLDAAMAARRYYRFGKLDPDWRKRIPPGCEIRRIDDRLLKDQRLANSSHVAGWVHSFWRTEMDFLKTGFGYCLVVGAEIASWCLTVYVSASAYELGLATVSTHRRQGFASLAAQACVEHCLSIGGAPHWHCWEENIGSIKVAERVGFVKPRPYDVYRFHLND